MNKQKVLNRREMAQTHRHSSGFSFSPYGGVDPKTSHPGTFQGAGGGPVSFQGAFQGIGPSGDTGGCLQISGLATMWLSGVGATS